MTNKRYLTGGTCTALWRAGQLQLAKNYLRSAKNDTGSLAQNLCTGIRVWYVT